jgi:hypothetical protein
MALHWVLDLGASGLDRCAPQRCRICYGNERMNDEQRRNEPEADLDLLGVAEGTDKSSSVSYAWDYLTRYQYYFERWRHAPINLIEIGVQSGASLKVWKSYFSRATIVGIDIDPSCVRFADDRVSIEIGSQDDPELLDRVCAANPPTIVIDDGSHRADHLIFTLERIFPTVEPGGLYIVEDLALHFREKHLQGSSPTSAPDYFKALAEASMARRPAPDWAQMLDTVTFIPGAAILCKQTVRDLSQAHRLAERRLKDRTATPEALGRLAEYLFRHNGSPVEAETIAKQAVELGCRDRRLLLLMTGRLIRREFLPEAADILEIACRAHDGDVTFWQRRAAVAARLGRLEDEITALQRVAALRPEDPPNQQRLSLAIERQGKRG